MPKATQPRNREPRDHSTMKRSVRLAALKDAKAKLRAAERERDTAQKTLQRTAKTIPHLQQVIAALEGSGVPPATPLPGGPPPPPPPPGMEGYSAREVPDSAGFIPPPVTEAAAGAMTIDDLPGMDGEFV